ncbi:GntR family transcriptional regulator [Actinomadura soli]|uniref:GntR family transcriptional regulator n=1 Tax=Actinomadura soli TaxID=2508997 RepID=A0A5C4JC33_9ACTN|nr:GntR family transcriptional regulator [Actinomadura soli]TMR00143.1 GntR family transcriptional regulator [Actinomadura soli]
MRWRFADRSPRHAYEGSQQYGVAIGTARRAIEELRDRGLVVTLASKGTFVVEPD